MMQYGAEQLRMSEIRAIVEKSQRRSRSSSMAPPPKASREKWPWAFYDYNADMTPQELLQRGLSLMQHVRTECKSLNAAVGNGDYGVSSTKDLERNVFAVHATAELATTIPSILQTLTGPRGTQFTIFLSRLLGDKIEETATHRHFGIDTNGRPWVDPTCIAPRMVSIGSFSYDDSSLLKKVTKEMVYLDFMHVHTNMRAVSRVFKSIDSDRDPSSRRNTERVKHVLFGFYIETIGEVAENPKIRVTFYGDFCLPSCQEPSKILRDVKRLLEKLGSAISLLQRTVSRQDGSGSGRGNKWCRGCLNSFSLFRPATTCTACTQRFCSDCLCHEEILAPTGGTFDVRVCLICKASIAGTPTPKPQMYHGICTHCHIHEGTKVCRLCGDHCCQDCCHSNPLGKPGDTCLRCTERRGSTHSKLSPHPSLLNRAQQQATQTAPDPLAWKPPEPVVLFDPSDFACRTSQALHKYLLRISEGNEIENLSPDTIEQIRVSIMGGPPFRDVCTPPLSPVVVPPEFYPQPECELPHRVDAESVRTSVVLDLQTNDALDELCLQTATRMECVYAFVNLIYKGSFMLKGVASIGQPAPNSIPRDCVLSKHSSALPLFVPDAEMDPRFSSSPLVTGKEHIRFYYGLPLVVSSGVLLGTVAVADIHPRVRMSSVQREHLVEFAYETAQVIQDHFS
ncbi:hypothetical protein LEN26_020820 [Aphanomyces euteiches]|nr:hypothetical protein LEN26_020820 [Aphanomyces euteiches]